MKIESIAHMQSPCNSQQFLGTLSKVHGKSCVCIIWPTATCHNESFTAMMTSCDMFVEVDGPTSLKSTRQREGGGGGGGEGGARDKVSTSPFSQHGIMRTHLGWNR